VRDSALVRISWYSDTVQIM